ncbi:hypothetical protein [Streptomyces cinereoruber]
MPFSVLFVWYEAQVGHRAGRGFDLGSGSNFHESSDWWLYDGTFRRPTAVSMRGRRACG